jgi:hypothetical protein
MSIRDRLLGLFRRPSLGEPEQPAAPEMGVSTPGVTEQEALREDTLPDPEE